MNWKWYLRLIFLTHYLAYIFLKIFLMKFRRACIQLYLKINKIIGVSHVNNKYIEITAYNSVENTAIYFANRLVIVLTIMFFISVVNVVQICLGTNIYFEKSEGDSTLILFIVIFCGYQIGYSLLESRFFGIEKNGAIDDLKKNRIGSLFEIWSSICLLTLFFFGSFYYLFKIG